MIIIINNAYYHSFVILVHVLCRSMGNKLIVRTTTRFCFLLCIKSVGHCESLPVCLQFFPTVSAGRKVVVTYFKC